MVETVLTVSLYVGMGAVALIALTLLVIALDLKKTDSDM
jgi:hypothetical protein